MHLCLLACVPQAVIAAEQNDSDLFKAAFIFNFAKLTSWPVYTWDTPDAALILCTAGKDKLVDELKQLNGKLIKGHPVSIQSLENRPLSENNCHVLLVATSEQPRFKGILKSLPIQPVLTVSELSGFATDGGIIEIFRKNNRTRFLINLDVARHSDLKISSRLLSMATVIGNREAP